MLHRSARWAAVRALGCAALACCGVPGVTGVARAQDAPFLRLHTAVVEDDDERNFEMGLRLSRTREEREFEARLEYNFSPLFQAEVQLAWASERGEPGRERELQLELRHVLVDHRREDWGLAVRLSAGWAHRPGGTWGSKEQGAALAFTWPIAAQRVNLHANLGLGRIRDDGTRKVWGLGADGALTRSVVLFGEMGSRVAVDRLVHGGVRWWLQREKVALDTSLSRTRERATGEAVRGVHVGLNFYDLDF
jgi:hypothetical protein